MGNDVLGLRTESNRSSLTGNPELRNPYCVSLISFMSISSPFVVKNQITVLAPSGDAFPTYVKRIQIYRPSYLTYYKKTPDSRKIPSFFFARSLRRGNEGLSIPKGIHRQSLSKSAVIVILRILFVTMSYGTNQVAWIP